MNLEDIAKLAGVSRSTVSRVINSDPNVSARSRTRVQATIDEVDYRPHAAARALASHRSHAVGLVVPEDFSRYHVDSWYPLIIEATLSATRDAGQSLMLIMEDTVSPNAGDRLISRFIDTNRVDGLLVLQHSYRDQVTSQLMRRKVPFVLVAESDIPGASWVDNDNFAGGQSVAQIMQRQEPSSIYAIAATLEHVPTRRRVEGFQKVFPHSQIMLTAHSVQNTEDVVRKMLQQSRPDAVFAVNGWIAPVVHRVAMESGISIPQDMVLAAFDEFDPEYSEHINLTSVIQHVSLLAERAVKLLIDRVEGRAPPGERIVLDSSLVLRGSCNELRNPVLKGGAAALP